MTEILRKGWGTDIFNLERKYQYDRQTHIEVPCFINTINGLNQSQSGHGIYIRYYAFTDETLSQVDLSSRIEHDPVEGGHNYIWGNYGVTDEMTNMFGVSDSLHDNTKYIGYEVSLDGIDWLKGGSYDVNWSTGAVSGTPEPIILRMLPGRVDINIIGNTETFDYDGEEHTVSGFTYTIGSTSSREENSSTSILRELFANNQCNILYNGEYIGESADLTVSNYEGGVDRGPGKYTSKLKVSGFSLGPYDRTAPSQYLTEWKQFEPVWNIMRQISVVIEGEETQATGIGIPVSATKVYDGLPLCPVVENNLQGVSVEYSEDGIHFGSSPISITDVGSKYVTVRITGLPGYEDSLYGYYSITVSPRPIYINSDSHSWNYNGEKRICDWVTVQGHYDETQGTLRIQTRFTPPDVQGRGSVEDRKIVGIPLINQQDSINITFKGGQTEIGSSSNSFDFEIKSDKPNNYDVRVEFGLLKVNLSSQDIYVFIRGNTRGTWYDPDDFTDPVVRNYIIWDNSFIPTKDRSCIYNGGIWTVSGWQVVAVTDDFIVIPDPFDPHNNITLPAGNDMSDTYGVKDIEFMGKDSAAEVSGLYINDISDYEDENFWKPVEYRSTLSANNFRNINSGFSPRYIHFVVSPNRLLISKNPTEVLVTGHHNTFDFNMIKSLGSTRWIPEFHTIEGYDLVTDNTIYDVTNVVYRKPNPRGGKDLTKPFVSASVWNESNDDPEDGKWYMHLENDIHDGESDKDEPFVPVSIDDPDYPNKGSFINTNKNFEVSFAVDDDGWILINPLEVNVKLLGTQEVKEYNAEEQEIRGTHDNPEIWWRTEQEFFNQDSKTESIIRAEDIEIEVSTDTDKKTVDDSTTETTRADAPSESDIEENPDTSHTEKVIRPGMVTYYRAHHDLGYFEWSNDGYVHGTEINDITDRDDPDYWNSIPYMMGLEANDFGLEDPAIHQFNDELDYPNHIAKNFVLTFDIVEDGWLKITPYSKDVTINITGHTDTIDPYDGSEHTVQGFDVDIEVEPSEHAPNIHYDEDWVNYIDFRDGKTPNEVQISGTATGLYSLGLSNTDFRNINKNFEHVEFEVVDGWLQIGNLNVDLDIVFPDSQTIIFDGQDHTLEDPTGVFSSIIKRQQLWNPTTGTWSDWEEKADITMHDVGSLRWEIEGDSTTQGYKDISGGTFQIVPLHIRLLSNSASKQYDESALEEHSVTYTIINDITNTPVNISDIVSYIEGVINNLEWTGSQTEVGSSSNTFSLGSDAQQNVLAGNLVVELKFGTLTVTEVSPKIEVYGDEMQVIYDGHSHSVWNYKAFINMGSEEEPQMVLTSLYFKPGCPNYDTLDKTDVGEYETVLSESDFDIPEGMEITIVNNITLTITPRTIDIYTGSATAWEYDLENLENGLRREDSWAFGLADPDVLYASNYPGLYTVGELDNEPQYSIRRGSISGSDVESNYEVTKHWGKLKVWEKDDAETQPYYRVMGIRKIKSTKENESSKVHVRWTKLIDGMLKVEQEDPFNAIPWRTVDEDRFYPLMHKLVPIDENGVVEANDIICIIPTIRHSKEITQASWMFENRSTGKKIFSEIHDRVINPTGEYGGFKFRWDNIGGLTGSPVLDVQPQYLEPGYYDVVLNYKMGDNEYSQRFSSVFMIKKPRN